MTQRIDDEAQEENKREGEIAEGRLVVDLGPIPDRYSSLICNRLAFVFFFFLC
jgi:hypothetical protein